MKTTFTFFLAFVAGCEPQQQDTSQYHVSLDVSFGNVASQRLAISPQVSSTPDRLMVQVVDQGVKVFVSLQWPHDPAVVALDGNDGNEAIVWAAQNAEPPRVVTSGRLELHAPDPAYSMTLDNAIRPPDATGSGVSIHGVIGGIRLD